MTVAAHHAMTNYPAAPVRAESRPAGLFELLLRLVGVWLTRMEQRRALGRADYRDLRDIGATRWDVEREMAKPFWRG